MEKDLKDKKILIVDDDIDSRLYLKVILGKFNTNITAVSNGCESIEILKKENFDIILMDVYMPCMNGISCVKCIREKLSITTPIIIITAGIMELHNDILPIVNKCIQKPFSPSTLIDTVKNCIL